MDPPTIHRRGLPGSSPQLIIEPPTTNWVQILGFPPDLWPEIRALLEQKCGHILEEVRHASCNWALVRFGTSSDAEEALKWNEHAVLEGVWVYVTRLTAAQAQHLSFPVNAPTMLAPEVTPEGIPDAPSPKPLGPALNATPQYISTPEISGTRYGVSDALRRLTESRLTRLYIIPIISGW
eukprot:Protomagalhaensia_sp_Gyna_25__231@NODE_1107_length_2184_cov_41_323077_g876_i0_p2_GENE_NODE_1107_length_2184_cov_41_323077_g876_i0NODE_1107_length_2184_cov_41_323077_g876_i0_p2_ORF_typecomplete_len180_score21_83Nup35_RRM/PF05172_13/4_5e09Nup35_RRM_2/PF14605_6/0_00079Nup35_RRM_2/PF14605_6/4_4e03Limkainb1/PF11608_8/0_066_NODE_1107_length_2184_cov_41_323077_g876_i013461885